ncbi:hypothetical protein C5E02_12330 [Rathayibacter rathayi]|uniref:Uncharacterized protein n=1 Tax=Rathayibacter rathayi TaxID=33887 RepID=A0ABX5ACI8_RATRA|nr:hypothetical protein [Rathayibacter rathayi]PPG94201.1 hypothetical protein C5C00_12610 [Rathayibacter rathayi]PPH28891.1 hypothetical protein C5C28_15225 [Rathayibacter rathayi]PPH75983.1 hypothetical protein C5C40_10100 [Rathayibacter rathayi]PPI59201.1 hypothetical protein C5E02_12330 [Rathayibacter rathayi]
MTFRKVLARIAGVLVAVVVVSACSSNVMTQRRDAAGMTRAEVAGLTLEEEFELNAQHYVHAQELLRDAQLRISDGVWRWNGGETLPEEGFNGGVGGGLPGGTGENSYYVMGTRIIMPPGARGEKVDLDPMRKYFEERGWQYYTRERTTNAELWGITGDGYRIKYFIQESGVYSVRVYSELFWTNDAHALFEAVASRDYDPFLEESLPGVYVPFPRWDNPVRPLGCQ